MKNSIALISLAFLLNCFCSTNLSAFMLSKKTSIHAASPCFAKKTTIIERFIAENAAKHRLKTGKPFDSARKARLSLILAGVSMAWLLLLRLSPYIGLRLALILSLIVLVVGTFGTLMVADDVLRDKTATDKQKNTAKSSKIMVAVNLILIGLMFFIALLASREG